LPSCGLSPRFSLLEMVQATESQFDTYASGHG